MREGKLVMRPTHLVPRTMKNGKIVEVYTKFNGKLGYEPLGTMNTCNIIAGDWEIVKEKTQDYVKKSHITTQNEPKSEKTAQDVQKNCLSLTEQWKRGELPKSNYWIKYISGKIDIWWLSEGVPIETRPEISEVLAPVPSYEEWQILNELLENSLQTSKTLSHILRLSFDPYFKGLKPEDIFELAKKSIRLTKQSCEDNTTIQRLKELLGYCADILEELDDKDRDIDILLEEIDEVLK